MRASESSSNSDCYTIIYGRIDHFCGIWFKFGKRHLVIKNVLPDIRKTIFRGFKACWTTWQCPFDQVWSICGMCFFDWSNGPESTGSEYGFKHKYHHKPVCTFHFFSIQFTKKFNPIQRFFQSFNSYRPQEIQFNSLSPANVSSARMLRYIEKPPASPYQKL